MCIKKTMMGVGAAVAVAAIGYLGYSQYQVMKQVSASNEAVTSLGTAIQALAFNQNNQSGGIDSKDLVSAIQESMALMAEQEAQAVLAEKNLKYSLASEIISNDIRMYGNSNARFTLTSYSDTECPYCKRYHPTPKKIIDESEGNVNWVFKHLPLSFHNPAAEVQAVAAECVGNIKGNRMFWAFVDDIFEYSGGGGQGVRNIGELAASYGIDQAEFNRCMSSNDVRAKVNAHMQDAQTLGITAHLLLLLQIIKLVNQLFYPAHNRQMLF